MTENKGILIYAQLTRNNEVLQVVSELASEAQKLSEKLNGEIIQAVLLTDGENLDEIKNSLKIFDKVYILKNEKFKKVCELCNYCGYGYRNSCRLRQKRG